MADTNEAQLLSDLLNDIAREDASLDAAHLEARVMACADASPTARLKPSTVRLKPDTTYLVIAAAVVTVVLLPARFWMKPQVSPSTAAPSVAATDQSIADTPRIVAASPVPARPTRRPRPAPPTRSTMPTQPTIPDSSPDEFLPLMPMTEQELAGTFQLVRVQMPRASLGALRSPLEHPNELVEADVLLGEDGMARAIRVSASGSVYPRRFR